MRAPTLLRRFLRFLARGDPLSFCVRVVPLLVFLPLLTLLPWFERFVQIPLMTSTAATMHAVLRLFGLEVRRQATYVSSPEFSVQVVEGCTGIYTLLILVAMTIAFPARWRSKALGIVLGGVLIGGLNIIRLVTLFLIGKNRPELFDEAHLFVWQTITVIIALLFWYLWAQRALARLEPAETEAGDAR